MAKKRNYTALDEIGFIGVDGDASPHQRIRQAKETAAFIRNFQASRVPNSSSARPPVRPLPRKSAVAAKSPFVTRERTHSRRAKTAK